jgi:hypothetical protein
MLRVRPLVGFRDDEGARRTEIPLVTERTCLV